MSTTTTRTYTRKPVTVKSMLAKENFELSANDDALDLKEIAVAENIVRRTLLQHPDFADALLKNIREAFTVDSEDSEG